ncbi:MAG: chemotaxis protein CheB [Tildeniella nuda ZEHNDER 1965/U140]|jgi:two-component system chemotaxis response regulator CheB|nr:chemotaxis protein CheB [Tildeniella nuda ZEHNDER 1965/U140]
MPFELVVVGTSLGGLSALRVLLESLVEPFPVAIAVVQHRHKESGNLMSRYMQQYTTLPVLEAEDKDELLPGHVYVAPADYHLLVERGYMTLSVDEPVCFARPSIDVLFESAADAYANRAIGVILTGANRDGTNGLARIKACGGVAIVQDPATAETGIMPQAAIAATAVDAVLPLAEIAPYLVNLLSRVRS